MSSEEKERMKKKESEKNPGGALNDAFSRSMVGDSGSLVGEGCLKNILTLIIFVIVILVLSQCFPS